MYQEEQVAFPNGSRVAVSYLPATSFDVGALSQTFVEPDQLIELTDHRTRLEKWVRYNGPHHCGFPVR